jgi:hypothetical protein
LVISIPQDISSQEETKKQNTGILKFPANIELVKMYSQKLKVMRNFFKKNLDFQSSCIYPNLAGNILFFSGAHNEVPFMIMYLLGQKNII